MLRNIEILDTADVTKRGKFDTATPADRRSMEAILQQVVSELKQVASRRHLPSSFGLPWLGDRDRATRLRSSDAQHPKDDGIPDAKDRDVVAIQLWFRYLVSIRVSIQVSIHPSGTQPKPQPKSHSTQGLF